MQIGKLDHVNVRTGNLDAMVDWYTNTLGLKTGWRPNFQFPGAWLYAGNQAIVHLVSVDGNAGMGSEADLKLEHFALSATGRAEFEARLTASDQEFRTIPLPDAGIVQYNVWDPDGNHIHIDFQLEEAS